MNVKRLLSALSAVMICSAFTASAQSQCSQGQCAQSQCVQSQCAQTQCGHTQCVESQSVENQCSMPQCGDVENQCSKDKKVKVYGSRLPVEAPYAIDRFMIPDSLQRNVGPEGDYIYVYNHGEKSVYRLYHPTPEEERGEKCKLISVVVPTDGSDQIAVERKPYRFNDDTGWIEVRPSENQPTGWSFDLGGGGDVFAGYSRALTRGTHFDNGFEFGVPNIMYVQIASPRQRTLFTLGFGMSMRTLYNSGNTLPQANHLGHLVAVPRPENASDVWGNLSNFSLNVPLLWHQRFNRHGLGFTLGGVAMLNTYSVANFHYRMANMTLNGQYDGLHQKFLTVDLYGSFNLSREFGIYCRWSPMSTFKAKWGPESPVISAGIVLMTF